MKIILLTVIVFIMSSQLFAQNLVDPAKVFERESRPEAINLTNDEFIRSWNWGSPGRALDEAMRINFYHDRYGDETTMETYTSSDSCIPGHRKAAQVTGVSGGRKSNFILNAHSQIIYPVIDVDPTSGFVPRAFDSTGSVFGFMNKNKVVILEPNENDSSDYHFALLNKASITSGPEVVLSNIWKNNIF